jgi:amino acid transporter
MNDQVVTTGHEPQDEDERTLHRLGYAQVLFREMGGFSNFAISFTIISILAGCLTSYFIAFNNGGPVAITWGWLIVGGFVVLVALAMGEVASAMPTAGAIYYWSSKLGSPAWGWFSGWFNLIGQVAVTAAIDYGAAIFWTSLLNLWFPDQIGTDTHTLFVVYSVIIALHLLINLNGVRLLALLNSFSAWWHMVGVAIIVLVLIVVPDHHQSASFVFTETINNSGFSGANFSSIVFWFVFGIGLLMAQYTYTGYDASAHMSEETQKASRAAAWGVVMSVVMSVIFGFVLLVAVTFAVPNVQGTLDAGGYAVTYIWQTSMSNSWAEFLLVIACVAQFFCGAASLTAASRMMFAFSRDGAVPGRTLWRRVSQRHRVPVYAVTAIAVLSWALMLPTLANGTIGYLVGTSVAVVGLYIAYGMPIYLRWRVGDAFEPGAWTLGRHYRWINPIAVVWILFVTVLFMMPTVPEAIPWNADFSWDVVNYAPITVGGVLLLVGVWWLVSARKWFKGPIREGTEAELERIEESYEAAPGQPAGA